MWLEYLLIDPTLQLLLWQIWILILKPYSLTKCFLDTWANLITNNSNDFYHAGNMNTKANASSKWY